MNDCLVVIPTYNEIENIAAIISAILTMEQGFSVLVVDDNSPDGTAIAVKKLMKQYPEKVFLEKRPAKLGLGTAYIHGFRWALERSYTYIFEMDADFSHNPKDLIRLYDCCVLEGVAVAIGSRYISGVNVVNWPMKRVLLSYIASKYVRLITGMKIQDTTAGFICYHRTVLETIKLDRIRFVGYAFQIEMKFRAYLAKFVIKEVPVIFTDRTKGTSKMSKGIISEAVFGVIKMKLLSYFKSYRA